MYLDEVKIVYVSQLLGQITNMPLFAVRSDGSLLDQYQSFIRPHPLLLLLPLFKQAS